MLKNWFGKHMNDDVTTKQLDPNIRIHNYDEVVLGYTRQEAIDEANRCLNCINKPCVNGCPIHNDIPNFISKIKEANFEEAYKIISSNSPIPSICSRVCPHGNQCQKNCTRGIKSNAINIGALERYVSDNYDSKQIKQESNNHKIAIVGSGPSGLACAKQLALLGYDVTIIEAENMLGGILTYGIPEFRLPKAIVQKEINTLNNPLYNTDDYANYYGINGNTKTSLPLQLRGLYWGKGTSSTSRGDKIFVNSTKEGMLNYYDAALTAAGSDSTIVNRIKLEGLAIRYWFVACCNQSSSYGFTLSNHKINGSNDSYNTIKQDALGLGVTRIGENLNLSDNIFS